MRLKNLKLTNFRNYKEIELELSKGINIFIGDNGSGKTNILEAIYVLALTKSNRFGNDNDLIKIGENTSSIQGEVLYENYTKLYQVDLDKFNKIVYINKTKIKKISDYISNFCITSFLPSDVEIIKGTPSLRRSVLNIQIGAIYNNYLKYMNEYNSILKIRNEYLKRLNINALADSKYLDVINDRMLVTSLKIYYYRFFYVTRINQILPKVFKKLSPKKEVVLNYENNLGLDSYDEDAIKKILKDKWQRNFSKELMQGMTLFGLHRDDLIFKINGEDAKIYASEGEQRLLVIAYKISELLLFKELKGEYPVLLLDDVFAELDIKKRNNVMKFFKEEMQVIITTTDLEDINADLIKNAKVFKIKNGEIKNKGGVRNGR